MGRHSVLRDLETEALLRPAPQPGGRAGRTAFVLGLVVAGMVGFGLYLYLAWINDVPGDISDAAMVAALVALLLFVVAWVVAIAGMFYALHGLKPGRPGRLAAAVGLVLTAPLALIPVLYMLLVLCAFLVQSVGSW